MNIVQETKEIIDQLKAIINAIADENSDREIGLNDLDSLQTIQFVKEINSYFNCSISVNDLINSKDFNNLADKISSKENYANNHYNDTLLDNIFPVTPAQESLLFINDIIPLKSTYNVFRVLKILGIVNIDNLINSIKNTIANHKVFHGHFYIEKQSFYFKYKSSELEVKYTEVVPAISSEYIEQIIQNRISTPIDIYQNKLIKFEILKESNNIHYLIVIAYHGIIDGWSMALIINEIINYFSGKTDKVNFIDEEYIKYAIDYNDYLLSPQYQSNLQYWSKQLIDAPQKTTLSTNLVTNRSYKGSTIYLSLPLNTSEAIFSYVKESLGQITVSNFLLTVLYIQMYLLKQQNDNIIGVTYFGRNKKEYDKAVGYFSTVLPMRIDIQGFKNFNELVKFVTKKFIEIVNHGEIPFNKITEALNITNRNQYNPLFQIMFNYQKINNHNINLGNISIEEYITHNNTAKFDLTLWVWQINQQLRLGFEYANELFDETSIQSIISSYLNILHTCLNNPDILISEISLLSQENYHHLIYNLNRTYRPYDFNISLVDLFEIQVEKNRYKVAIVDEKESLTYNALSQRINQLSKYLSTFKISEKSFIGVCVPRSCDMVICIFSLLKLGAVFVPLDPSYPINRINHMIQDSEVQYILTTANETKNLGDYSDKLIYIDYYFNNFNNLTDNSTILPKSINNEIIYLLYTSGSTGKPKGVLGSQKGLLNRCYWMWETYHFIENEVCCQKTALNFVDSLWEIFGPLLQGVKLVIVGENSLHSIKRFKNLLNQEQVSRITLVPSLLQAFLDDEKRINSLRLCICSGEVLSLSLLKKFRHTYPNAKLLNLYGSTEVAGDITYYDTDKWSNNEVTVPIGKPISNTAIYILDDKLQPVPMGMTGKIFATGAGIASGYWHKELETEQKFINSPWSNDKMYYMGDIGQYRHEGNIKYLGREDEQVKIRGVRIELGDIKNTLLRHHTVKNAAVRVIFDKRNILLIAYVVSSKSKHNQQAYFSQELLNFLIENLPPSFVPNAVIVVNKFPLMPNGKVNINVLPILLDIKAKIIQRQDLPYTKTQREIIQIFNKLLNYSVKTVDDEFFRLGGNSLLTMQLTAIINDKYNIELKTYEIFENPSVREVAQLVESALQNLQSSTLAIANKSYDEHNSKLSFSQYHVFMLEKISKIQALNNISLFFYIDKHINPFVLEKTLKEIITRHEILRTKFYRDNSGSYVQEVLPTINFCLKQINDFKEWDNSLQDKLQNISAQFFNLEVPPLMRATLFNLNSNQHLLLLNFHHLIIDGWSIRILFHEISIIYQATLNNVQYLLKPTIIDYKDYIYWQNNVYLKSNKAKKSLHFWQKTLSGINKGRIQGNEANKINNFSYEGNIITIDLKHDLVKKINNFIKNFDTNITHYTILLSSFLILVHIYTKNQDIIVGSPIAARAKHQYQNIIGCFINTLIIRQNINLKKSYYNLLTSIQKYLIKAYKHQELPFDYFIESTPDINLKLLFMFIYQNFNTPLQLENCRFKENILHNKTARFDLTLWVWQKPKHIRLGFEYKNKIFNEESIKELINNYLHILELCLINPTSSLNKHITYINKNIIQVNNTDLSKEIILSKKENKFSNSINIIQYELLKFWKKLLKVDNIKSSDDFFALGGNSLLAMQLLDMIEANFYKEIFFPELVKNSTLIGMSEYLNQSKMLETRSNIFLLNNTNQENNIFMIHPVTGFSYCYLHIAKLLHKYNLYGINEPFVFDKRNQFNSIEEMAKNYVNLIKEFQSNGKFILAGWSFGGVVAYEIANQLNKQGVTDIILLMFDSFNASAFLLERWNIGDLKKHLNTLGISEDYPYFSELINKIKINNTLLYNYTPPKISADIILFKANIYSELFITMQQDNMNGWNNINNKKFKVVKVDMRHEEMFSVENSIILAEITSKSIY